MTEKLIVGHGRFDAYGPEPPRTPWTAASHQHLGGIVNEAYADYWKQRAEEAERESATLVNRCAAAIALLSDTVRVGELQDAERAIKVERDEARALLQRTANVLRRLYLHTGLHPDDELGKEIDATLGNAPNVTEAVIDSPQAPLK